MAVSSFAYLDIDLGTTSLGRIVIELFAAEAPKAVHNFQLLCRGTQASLVSGTPLTYANTYFHRVIKNFMIQGGDVNLADTREITTEAQYLENKYAGMGGESVFAEGDYFEGENLTAALDKPFLVAMANDGEANHNKSQFFITTYPAPHLTGKHTVFGRVVRGKSVVRDIERVGTFQTNLPNWNERVCITGCGDWAMGDAVPVFNASNWSDSGDVYEEYPDDDDTINHESSESVFQAAEIIKEAGTVLFRAKDKTGAFFKYRKALRYINEFIPGDDHPAWNARYLEMKKKLYLNLSLVCAQTERYTDSARYAELLLELDADLPEAVACTPAELTKAWFRRGTAYARLNRPEEAVKALRKAGALAPEDALVEKELGASERVVQAKKERERKKYALFFS